jgi:hypothetical protein
MGCISTTIRAFAYHVSTIEGHAIDKNTVSRNRLLMRTTWSDYKRVTNIFGRCALNYLTEEV